MIRKLLLSHLKPFQLALTWIGATVGLFLLVAAVQFYLDFKELLTVKNDLLRTEFLVINKKVTLLNTLSGRTSTFDKDEIAALEKVKGIKSVGTFTSNHFKAAANISAGGMGMAAELFFEAVPDEFLDVKTADWNWEENDNTVPIILPADYLKLYNFGFAPSQQLPQIPQGALEGISLDIKISGKKGRAEYRGKVAGFTNRINSILVPKNFLDYANKEYGEEKEFEPSRLVLMVDDPTSKELLDKLEGEGYETNSEQLRNAKLTMVLRIILAFVLVTGDIIVMLAIFGFVQFTQLLLYRSSYEIKTLAEIGYKPSAINAFYRKYVLILMACMTLAIIALVWLVKTFADEKIRTFGFDINSSIRQEVYIELAALALLFSIIQLIVVRQNIYKIVSPQRK